MSYSLNSVIINPSSKSSPKNAVILCHGYGGDGNDIFHMQGQDSVAGGDGEDDFKTGGWYDANSVLLKTGNDDFATIEDFSSSGNKSDFLIVEVPSNAAGTFTVEAVENPAGSGLYDV